MHKEGPQKAKCTITEHFKIIKKNLNLGERLIGIFRIEERICGEPQILSSMRKIPISTYDTSVHT